MREEAKNTKKLDNKGFSLIELIIVIAIMAILIGIVGTQVVPYIEKSKQAKDQQVLSGYLTAATTAFASNAELLTEGTTYTFNVGSTSAAGSTAPDAKIVDEFYELAGLTTTTTGSTGTTITKATLSDIKAKMNSKAGKAIDSIVITRDGNGVVTVKTTVTGKYKDVFGDLSST